MSATTKSALDQLLLDIFTTALEGGINYWSSCTNYHWIAESHDGRVTREDHMGFYADILLDDDAVDEGESAARRIDRSVLAKGYRLATTTHRDKIHWSSGEKPPLVVGPDTDWDFDADDADVIVQLGLFEDARFG
jgi:hypothetical protein